MSSNENDPGGAITPLRSMIRHGETGSLIATTNADPSQHNMSFFGYDAKSGTCCNINYNFISGIPSNVYVNSTSGEVWRFSFIKTTDDEGMYDVLFTNEIDINTFTSSNAYIYDTPPNHAGVRGQTATGFGWDAVHTITKPFNDDFRSNVISYYIENGKAVINKQHALSRAYTNNTTVISAAFHKVRDGPHYGPYRIRHEYVTSNDPITIFKTDRHFIHHLSDLTYTQLQLTEDDINCYIDISGLNITDSTFPRYENMLVLHFAINGYPGQEVRCFKGGDPRLLDLKSVSSTDTSITVDVSVKTMRDWTNNTFHSLPYQYKLYDMTGTLLQTSAQQTKLLAGPNAPANPYTFTGLSSNNRYKVRAIQLDYNNAGSALYTLSTLLPPITVTASNITTDSCRLTWGDLSAGEHVTVTTSTGALYKLTGTYYDFGQSPNTSVTYTIQKNGIANATTKTNVTVLTLPRTPVVQVTNTQNSVSIAWTPVDAASYKVYNGSTLLTTTTIPTYTNTSPVGTTLALRVEAIFPGNVSTTSATVSATVGITAPVISVSSHSAPPVQNMVITWPAISVASSYVIGYYDEYYKSYTDNSETTSTSYTQTGSTTRKLYVRAKYGSVVSAPSNVITYTSIAPPTKLTATPSSDGSTVTLTWTRATDDTGSNTYYIYRESGNQTGPQFGQIATTTAATITVEGVPTTTKTYLVSNGPVTTQYNPVYDFVNGMPAMIGYAEYVTAGSPTAFVTVSAVINPVTVTDVSVGNVTVDMSWNQVSAGCTYHIQRTYNGVALSTIDTQDTHVSIDAIVDPVAPTVYTVTAELNGVVSMAAGQQTFTLYNPPLLYLDVATQTTGACYFTKQTGSPVYRILNMATGAAVSYTTVADPSLNRIQLTGLTAGTTYTFGLQVQNSVLGSNVWSAPNTLTFTTPAAIVPITVASLTPTSATFTFSGTLSRVDVYTVVEGENVFVTSVEPTGNTFTVDSLTPKTVYNFVFRTYNANSVPAPLSDPLQVTMPHMPHPPTIAIEGSNVVFTTADDDLTAITIVNADTDAVISTLAGNATSVSISSLTAGVSDLQLNIQAIASNAYTANDATFVTRSNTLALQVTPTAGSLSLASWLTEKSSTAQPSDIKEQTRSNPEAFSSSTASVSNDIVYKMLDTINPSFVPPTTSTAVFVNPTTSSTVNVTDSLDTLVYLNSNINETVQLEYGGNVYTVTITATGFTYNGTAYVLGDNVVFDASFGTTIQGLGSLLLQPYNPSVTLTVNGVDYSILPTATGFTYNGTDYVVGDIIQFGGVSYTIQGVDPVTLQVYTPPTVPCFLGSARVLTPAGYVRIADLRVGDRIKTADERVVAIARVSVHTVAATGDTNPFVIPRGLYGAVRDIRISPDHKILVDGVMMEAHRAPGLEREEHQGTLTYYNLELPDVEDRMVVDGVVCESLAHVRRVVVTMADFITVLRRKYGTNISPQTLQRIQHTCRFLADGRVEIPVMRR